MNSCATTQLAKRKNHYWIIGAAVCFLISFLGCGGPAFRSHRAVVGLTNQCDTSREGVAYFLPSGRVHIYAVRNVDYVTNVVGIDDFLQSVYEYATNTVIQIKAPLNSVGQQLQLTLASSSALTNTSVYTTTNRDTNGNFLITTNTTGQSITTSNAPIFFTTNSVVTNIVTTTVTFKQPLIKTNYNYTMVISNEYSADPDSLFFLHPSLDAFHDDIASVTVDNNGLLTSVNASNTDESGAVIVTLAKTAEQAFELVASGGMVGGGMSPKVLSQELKSNTQTIEEVDAQVPPLLTEKERTNLEKIIGEKLPDWTVTNFKISALDSSHDHSELQREKLAAILNKWITSSNQMGIDDLKNHLNQPEAPKAIESILNHAAQGGEYQQPLIQLARRLAVENVLQDGIAHINIIDYLVSVFSAHEQIPPQYIDITFDPFSPEEMRKASNILSDARITIDDQDKFLGPHHYDQWTNQPSRAIGVFYRPPIPYQIVLRDSANNAISRTVLLPNRSPILHLDLKKSPMVTRVSSVTLNNGFITSYSVSKPSSALAGAMLPMTLVTDLASSITNFVQLRINLASGQNSLDSATLARQQNQLTAITNALALITAQQNLMAARSNAPAH